MPTWRASAVVFLYSPRGLSADVGNGGSRQHEIGPAAVATLTAPTPQAPSTAAKGAWRLLLFGELLRDLQERARFGLVLVKERGEAEHVQRGRVFLVGGDDQLRLRVYVVSVGN